MTAPVDFRALLQQPTDSAERPRPLPEGHYHAVIKEHKFGTSKQKQTPYVRFMLSLEAASDDVHPDDIAGVKVEGREMWTDFYLTPNSMYRLTDFLDAVLGKQQGRTFDERIPETRDQRVLAQVTRREGRELGEYFNDVGKVVAA